MNSPSEKNTSDSLLQALLEKNTQDLAEIQLKPYTPTVYAIPDTIWTAMINLLQNAATFQPTLYQKLQPLATWEEVQELAAQMGETQEQTVQKALSLVAQNNRQAARVGFSKTPMGPFQTTVLEALTASAKSFMVSGPMSQPSMSAGIAVTGTTVVSTGASMGSGKSLMQTASTGSSSFTPFS